MTHDEWIKDLQNSQPDFSKRGPYRYSDGATYSDNLTLEQAEWFKKAQGGGKITLMHAPSTVTAIRVRRSL